jgi:hypothetical protein
VLDASAFQLFILVLPAGWIVGSANFYIERFNRSYRTEVLNAHLFESIAELRALTDMIARSFA